MPQEKLSVHSRVERILTMDLAAGLKTKFVPNDGRVRSRILRILTMDLFGSKGAIEYLEPTPESRRKAIRLVVIGIVVGIPLILATQWFFEVFLKSLPKCDQIPWGQGLIVFATFGPTIMAAIMLPQAIRMLSADQWPPHTWARYHRVRLVRGRALRIRGGLLLALCLACLPFPLYYLYPMMKFTSVFDGSALDRCRELETAKQKKLNSDSTRASAIENNNNGFGSNP